MRLLLKPKIGFILAVGHEKRISLHFAKEKLTKEF